MIKVRLPLKALFSLAFLGSLIFIGMGDSFLPKPLGTYSTRTRNQLNRAILTAVGHKVKPTGDRLKNSRYATENVDSFFDRAVDEAEKQGTYDQKVKKSKF